MLHRILTEKWIIYHDIEGYRTLSNREETPAHQRIAFNLNVDIRAQYPFFGLAQTPQPIPEAITWRTDVIALSQVAPDELDQGATVVLRQNVQKTPQDVDRLRKTLIAHIIGTVEMAVEKNLAYQQAIAQANVTTEPMTSVREKRSDR